VIHKNYVAYVFLCQNKEEKQNKVLLTSSDKSKFHGFSHWIFSTI
jgi:hypothetical protein